MGGGRSVRRWKRARSTSVNVLEYHWVWENAVDVSMVGAEFEPPYPSVRAVVQ